MAYFADLSPYGYGRRDDEGCGQDRNVGWLASGREVPTGAAPDDLVEALLVCATRPVREYRGVHDCELCDAVPVLPRSPGERWNIRTPHPASRMQLDGREVRLGNGEIRVRGPNGLWYAAPTLVAHYVAAHRYLPPTQFIDGVRVRAKALYVLRGTQLARLLALDFADQLDAALRVLRALAAHVGVDVEPYVPRLIAIARGDEPWKSLHVTALDETVTSDTWWDIACCFRPDRRDTTRGLIALFERAADAGLEVDGV